MSLILLAGGNSPTSSRQTPHASIALMHRNFIQFAICNFHFAICNFPAACLRFTKAMLSNIHRCILLVLLALTIFCVTAAIAAEGHWVTTWGCGPQLTEPNNLPPAPLANSTLRQFVHVTLGGKHLRVRFSNAYGTNAVTINSAHIA